MSETQIGITTIPEKHANMVEVLAKPGADISKEMDPKKWGLLIHHVQEMIETGKKLDKIKKIAVYNKTDPVTLGQAPVQIPTITDEQYHLLHMAVGIAGEAAEILEAVVGFLATGTLDRENAVEELGDLEFYIEGFRQGIEVPRDYTLSHNLQKLAVRYQGYQYSNEAAQKRADKE